MTEEKRNEQANEVNAVIIDGDYTENKDIISDGDVIINGSLLSKWIQISARGDVIINGHWFALDCLNNGLNDYCRIISEKGNVVIHGSILVWNREIKAFRNVTIYGDSWARIRTSGNVDIKGINRGRIEADGDVQVLGNSGAIFANNIDIFGKNSSDELDAKRNLRIIGNSLSSKDIKAGGNILITKGCRALDIIAGEDIEIYGKVYTSCDSIFERVKKRGHKLGLINSKEGNIYIEGKCLKAELVAKKVTVKGKCSNNVIIKETSEKTE